MSELQMSMFYVFNNSFTLWPDAYECPQNMTTERFERPILGSFFLFVGIFFVTLYIPCFLVIMKKTPRNPVYQVMFALAFFDISSLCVNAICAGVFDIFGISFCNYPLLIYCLGSIATGSWISGCLSCILLAIERCVEINSDFPLEFLFRKNVFPIVRILSFCFFIYTYSFTRPAVFSAHYSCWMFDPLIGKDPNLYFSWPHAINNIVVSIATTVLYVYMSYRLIHKYGYSTSMWLYKTKRQILIQAISLCSFHTVAASLYIYMQLFPTTFVMLVVSQFLWQCSSGAVCLSYLFFNRTIRNSVLKMIIPKKTRQKFGLHIGVDEHLAVEIAAACVPAVVPGINASGGVIKFDNYL
uniref:Serpentine Receptor, class T n=1 Tax=Caenorhabditis tropicalis TaxID=1561998 RepID=A0A1I7T8Z8_9PELO